MDPVLMQHRIAIRRG